MSTPNAGNGSLGWFSDTSGNVAALFALSAPVVFAAGGLAVDVSIWAHAAGNAQGAADQAALAVAVASGANGATDAALKKQAIAVAAENGFVDGVGGVSVTVNHPPSSGVYAGNVSAYEVLVSQSQNMFLAGLVFSTPPTVTGRAVTVSGGGGQGACVIALDPTDKQTISLNGGGSIYAPNCDVADNSTSNTSVALTGNGGITANNFITSGNYSTSGGNAVVNAQHVYIKHAATADPLASLQVPSWTGCTYSGYSVNTNPAATMSPGVYCGDVNINSSTVTMAAGVYIVTGSFKVAGNSTINASGVSVVMTGMNGVYGSMSLPGGTVLNLTAPTSGAMKNVAIYFDRNAPYNTDSVTGGTGMNISGALYFPTRLLTYAGGGSVTSKCLKAIAYKINITGISSFDLTNCPAGGSPYAYGIPLE